MSTYYVPIIFEDVGEAEDPIHPVCGGGRLKGACSSSYRKIMNSSSRDSCGCRMAVSSQANLLFLIGSLAIFLYLPETHFTHL